MAKKIIDVSAWQGIINFNEVKKAGIEGVIIRAGYGRNNIDPMFETYAKGAINAGLPIGVYWFSYAYTEDMAMEEAAYCLNAIAPYKITLPIFFDWEYDSMNYFQKMTKRTATKREVTDMYSAFMGNILLAGYKAGYYTNPDFLARLIDEKEIDGYYKWLAFYTTTPQTDCDIWQYSAEYIPGCSVKVDMDILNNERLIEDVDKDEDESEDDEMKFSELEVVKMGSKGDAVRLVQAAVNTAVDGIAGANTDKAIRAFQKKNKLSQDGIVGPMTWEAIWKTAK